MAARDRMPASDAPRSGLLLPVLVLAATGIAVILIAGSLGAATAGRIATPSDERAHAGGKTVDTGAALGARSKNLIGSGA
jgi:hypothetical protein